MSAVNLPDEVRECFFRCGCGCGREGYTADALPLMVATELEHWAAEFEADVPKLRFDHGQPFRASQTLAGRAEQMRARAAELRGETQ